MIPTIIYKSIKASIKLTIRYMPPKPKTIGQYGFQKKKKKP